MAEVVRIPLRLVSPHPQALDKAQAGCPIPRRAHQGRCGRGCPERSAGAGQGGPEGRREGVLRVHRGRAVPRAGLLYEETGEERFSVFNAYVDSNRSLLDLFLRVRSENEDGKGERVGLSTLEKIFGLHKISASIPLERLDDEMKRELTVAQRLDEKRIMKLFEVETASHFRFRLEHLERLCQIGDARQMYESAACVAGLAIPPERIESAVEGRGAARTFRWFGSVFPEFAKPKEERPSEARAHATGSSGGERRGQTDSGQRQLEIHETEVILLACPECGVENMLQARLEAEVTVLPRDPEGISVTATADAVVSSGVKCYGCGTDFRVFVKRVEGRRFAAEASLSSKFREPREETQAFDLRFDRSVGVWQKLEGEKVVGLVRTRGAAKEARV